MAKRLGCILFREMFGGLRNKSYFCSGNYCERYQHIPWHAIYGLAELHPREFL
jgi:hypothetical protein